MSDSELFYRTIPMDAQAEADLDVVLEMLVRCENRNPLGTTVAELAQRLGRSAGDCPSLRGLLERGRRIAADLRGAGRLPVVELVHEDPLDVARSRYAPTRHGRGTVLTRQRLAA